MLRLYTTIVSGGCVGYLSTIFYLDAIRNKQKELHLLKQDLFNINIKNQIRLSQKDFILHSTRKYTRKDCKNLKRVLPDYQSHLFNHDIFVDVKYEDNIDLKSLHLCHYKVSS
jgi:hypothetical protein